MRRSLERRKALIESIQHEADAAAVRQAMVHEAAEGEDGDDEDDDSDLTAQVDDERDRLIRIYQDPQRREQLEKERIYLHDYISQLGQVFLDSKFKVFQERLAETLAAGDRVIVFTQYLDTLDFIRDGLVARFGEKVACYSGRGGEVWDSGLNCWRVVDKAEVKARCRRNHPQAVQILLGTDAASEGLNLQQFSALFNYDLPWNPMRVEQRIGRIDRIGQEVPEVTILNLYMEHTIEEDTYLTLKDRIRLFEEVVGPLQPILAEMPRIFRRVARGEMEIAEARRLIADVARSKPESSFASLEQFVEHGMGASNDPAAPSPATQEQLAAWCLSHPAPGMRVTTTPEPGGSAVERDGTRACLAITWASAPAPLGLGASEEILATFSGELADRHPPTARQHDDDGKPEPGVGQGVRLLTWGDPVLEQWLLAIRGAPLTASEFEWAGLRDGDNPFAPQSPGRRG